jgi:predicted metal-dependent HD superfamily phosphohydrolase
MNEFNPERWTQLWRMTTGQTPPLEYFWQLATMYSEPHRLYHNERHVADCLTEFDIAREATTDSPAIELAIWFHDAIYEPHAADNEERSAQLAGDWIQKFGGKPALADSVQSLVLATKTHESSNINAALLLDVDLSILGQPPERFDEYEQQIREEYAWVEPSVFAAKRAKILGQFLARDRIYRTDYFFQRLEFQARLNLQVSVEKLTKGNTV